MQDAFLALLLALFLTLFLALLIALFLAQYVDKLGQRFKLNAGQLHFVAPAQLPGIRVPAVPPHLAVFWIGGGVEPSRTSLLVAH